MKLKYLFFSIMLILIISCSEDEGPDIASKITGDYLGSVLFITNSDSTTLNNQNLTVEKISNSEIKLFSESTDFNREFSVKILESGGVITGEARKDLSIAFILSDTPIRTQYIFYEGDNQEIFTGNKIN